MLFKEVIANLPHKTTPLMKKAAAVLDTLPLNNLREYEFDKNVFEYSYVFQYPPPAALQPIETEKIWSHTPSEIETATHRKIGLYVHIPY